MRHQASLIGPSILLLCGGCASSTTVVDGGTSGSGGAAGAELGGAQPGGVGSAGSGGSGGVATGGRSGEAGSSSETGSSETGGSETGGSGGTVGPLPCADERIVTGVLPPLSSTAGADDDFQLSCASGTAPDVAYEWTAPSAGYYVISTTGSDFDTVLGVMTSACDSPSELACNDDYATLPQSELIHYFAAEERALLVVDGKSGAAGSVALTVEPVTCPAQDISGQPLPLSLTTVGGTNSQAGACGGAGLRERTLRWTAPSDGIYQFTVTSAAIQPALHLERGPRCGGDLVQCIADHPATIGRFLHGGEVVTLIVDSVGGEGSFELNVVQPSGTCPTYAALPAYGEVVTLDSASPDLLTGSCTPPFATLTGEWPSFVEHSYPLEVDLSGIAELTVTIDGNQPFSAYVLRGTDCGGEEVHCSVAAEDNEAFRFSHDFGVEDNGTYTLVIESDYLPFEYTVSQFFAA